MKHATFGWQTRDGLRIFAQCWQPDTVPVGAVGLVHGQGEHSSRYNHVATAMANAGYGLITFDLPGHGQSEGRRGDVPAYHTLLATIDDLLAQIRQQFSHLPHFLYGHSMGGNLVLNYLLRNRPPLAGAIVTSPWLRLAFTPPKIQLALVKLVNRLWPSLSIRSKLDTTAISRDRLVVEAYQTDPLIHDRISVRQLRQIAQAGQWALAHAHEFWLPLLLLHGSADRITSPAATRQFASRVPAHCTLKLWEGLYHEPHNEPEKQEVINFIIEWIKTVTKQKAGAALQ